MESARQDYMDIKEEYETLLLLSNKEEEIYNNNNTNNDNNNNNKKFVNKYLKQLQEMKSMMNVAEV